MKLYLNTSKHKDKLAETALMLNAVIETAIDGIIVINEKGLIKSVNPAAAKMFGYEKGELLGKAVNDLMPTPHSKKHNEYINRYMQTGEARIIGVGREVEALCKNGTRIPIRLAISEVEMPTGVLFTGIIHDLSEVKNAEAKIRKLNERLEEKVQQRTEELFESVNKLLEVNQRLTHEVKERGVIEEALRKSESDLREALEIEKELNALKSRFVSIASHEFRTPLSAILSSADLIGAYTTTRQQGKREKHVNRIRSAVANLTGILNDFLSLSKLEEGKIELTFTNFELNDFCCQVKEEMGGLLRPGQRIIYDGLSQAINIFSDEKLLRNILINLLSNAIKYSHLDRDILNKIRIKNDKLIIQVIDEGIGIPEEDQQHLFTRFYRAHNVENIKGTGLGLNIVKKYLSLLGGTITFSSQLGKGSVFTVSLPLKTQMD